MENNRFQYFRQFKRMKRWIKKPSWKKEFESSKIKRFINKIFRNDK